MSGGDYASRILGKYGWKEGEGLGKDQQGISKPISVASQKSTEGIGYKNSLFEPWWDDLYDKVASKIKITKGEEKKEKTTERLSKSQRRKKRFKGGKEKGEKGEKGVKGKKGEKHAPPPPQAKKLEGPKKIVKEKTRKNK